MGCVKEGFYKFWVFVGDSEGGAGDANSSGNFSGIVADGGGDAEDADVVLFSIEAVVTFFDFAEVLYQSFGSGSGRRGVLDKICSIAVSIKLFGTPVGEEYFAERGAVEGTATTGVEADALGVMVFHFVDDDDFVTIIEGEVDGFADLAGELLQVIPSHTPNFHSV